jgi:hypothetical protein
VSDAKMKGLVAEEWISSQRNDEKFYRGLDVE